ncbi:hypothetical protein V5F40_09085 [Xanthobacter sp. DSM 14520]|uniref:hypothetical protein n=1 Tax=Xanthobacter autotrophicus (strain ATCC BAA-1158 / Py2) TaxID=78245 RepID=UPI00372CE4F0
MTSPERIAHEMLTRGQATGQRADVPAPPAPALRPDGIGDRALSMVFARRTSHEVRMWRVRFEEQHPGAPVPTAALPVHVIDEGCE